jgi:hypothetical protein
VWPVLARGPYLLQRHKETFTLKRTGAGRKLLADARHHRLSVTAAAEQMGPRPVHSRIKLSG